MKSEFTVYEWWIPNRGNCCLKVEAVHWFYLPLDVFLGNSVNSALLETKYTSHPVEILSYFMQVRRLLPFFEQIATGVCPKPNSIHMLAPSLSNVFLNVELPSTFGLQVVFRPKPYACLKKDSRKVCTICKVTCLRSLILFDSLFMKLLQDWQHTLWHYWVGFPSADQQKFTSLQRYTIVYTHGRFIDFSTEAFALQHKASSFPLRFHKYCCLGCEHASSVLFKQATSSVSGFLTFPQACFFPGNLWLRFSSPNLSVYKSQ
jgi:hypothetical protein